jgi:FKBP-type peptidyl-prolyl cis-trans isomerase SlyD
MFCETRLLDGGELLKVAKDRVISIDYTIREEGGEVVESSRGGPPLRYLHGRSQLVSGVERAIDGTEAGTEVEVALGPDDGYGERDPSGVFLVPRAAFPTEEGIAAGMMFSAVRPDGETIIFRVVRVDDDVVLVDTNHPLAGKRLNVWVAVRDVREATTEELFHGRVHAEGEPPPLLS